MRHGTKASHQRHEWDAREGWFDPLRQNRMHVSTVGISSIQKDSAQFLTAYSGFMPVGYGRILADFAAEYDGATGELSVATGDVVKLLEPRQALPRGWLYARKGVDGLYSQRTEGLVPETYVEVVYQDLRPTFWRPPEVVYSITHMWEREQATVERNIKAEAAMRAARLRARLNLALKAWVKTHRAREGLKGLDVNVP